jgi:hypothetical protein
MGEGKAIGRRPRSATVWGVTTDILAPVSRIETLVCDVTVAGAGTEERDET